jgi:hypothetical protein
METVASDRSPVLDSWVHELVAAEQGCLLLANPDVFKGTQVMLTEVVVTSLCVYCSPEPKQCVCVRVISSPQPLHPTTQNLRTCREQSCCARSSRGSKSVCTPCTTLHSPVAHPSLALTRAPLFLNPKPEHHAVVLRSLSHRVSSARTTRLNRPHHEPPHALFNARCSTQPCCVRALSSLLWRPGRLWHPGTQHI